MITSLVPKTIFPLLLIIFLLLIFFNKLLGKGGRVKDGYVKVLENRKTFIDCIRRNHTNLQQFVTGEGSYIVFTEDVISALEETEETPEFIFGPVISVDENRKSPLVERGKEGKFKFYRSVKRHSIHFRVCNNHLYIEWPHKPNALERRYTEVNGISSEIKRYQKIFKKIKLDSIHIPADQITKEFYFLTIGDLEKINYDENIYFDEFKDKIERMNIPYHYGTNG